MFTYLGGLLLGWSLGANDSANVFGTAVSSKMVKFRVAVILIAIFVILGAWLQGAEGIETLQKLSDQTPKSAAVVALAAALTVAVMTGFKIPVSTSQAVVGAIIGLGLMRNETHMGGLVKIVICWIGTPIGGMLFCIIFYKSFRILINKFQPSLFRLDPIIRIGLIVCGCYGAYALGANNVGNAAAVFVSKDMLTPQSGALLGGIAIAVGAVTYSRNVMMTVGKGIVKLDSYSAFICVLAHAVTLHIFAIIGVPVSSSQAIVGAVLGVSMIKGFHVVNIKVLRNVFAGWMATPVIAALVAVLMYFITNLKYVP
jgi:inorganic phosphate transporter, PiT family